MKILSFACEKVHGYLSFNTKFNDGLTFLTGINGSGKTTAVRAITALLTPSIKELANLSYGLLSVNVLHKGDIITIYSTRSEDSVSLHVSTVKKPLLFSILQQDSYEPRSRFNEREYNFYREQEALNSSNPVLIALESLPTPMFLDLERRHQIGTRRRRDTMGRIIESANPLAGSVIDSIIDAQRLAEDAYRHYLSRRAILTDILKQNLILATFDLSGSAENYSGFSLQTTWTLKQIKDIERVMLQSLRQIGISNERITEVVNPFFQRVREVVRDFPSVDELREEMAGTNVNFNTGLFKKVNEWSAIQPQVRKINELRELINKYNIEVKRIYEPIERYVMSINKFLEDSSKLIQFSPDGNLRVKANNYDISRPLEALSSGERQLVVILTHLAFNNQAKLANVLIIDEPELSLHLRWQELFVDSLIAASPGVQLILATHSPSIIKTRVSDCVDVQEAYTL